MRPAMMNTANRWNMSGALQALGSVPGLVE